MAGNKPVAPPKELAPMDEKRSVFLPKEIETKIEPFSPPKEMVIEDEERFASGPQKRMPQWLNIARIWIIFKLGFCGLIMLALAVTFAFTIEIQVAIYPFLGFLLCVFALAVFFWRWTHETPKL